MIPSQKPVPDPILKPKSKRRPTSGLRDEPRVSVIIVTWNRLRDVLITLKYLDRVHYGNFETIVVDDGSTDGTVDTLQQRDDIRLIRAQTNGGPAAARNLGAEKATGEYLFFLDSDALLSKRGLAKLVERMEAAPDVGVIGCRITNFFNRKIDQWFYAGRYAKYGDVEFETYSFSCAGAMVRASLFHSIDGFWEDLAMYNEEVDLSLQVIRAGYRILYTPAVRVYHRVSPDARKPLTRYYHKQARNWILIFYRHYPFWPRWRNIALYSCVYLVKGALRLCLKDAVRGLVDGMCARHVVHRFPHKLDRADRRYLRPLNRRWRLNLTR